MRSISFDQIPRFTALLRSHFLAGVMVVVPIGVIVWIALAALQTVWGLQDWLPTSWQPENWMPSRTLAALVSVLLMLATTLLLALFTSLVGWISKQLLGKKILEFVAEHLIQRIPVLRGIHKALDQLLRTLAQGGGQQFNRVVLVEYPRKGLWSLAFVTGPATLPGIPPGHLNIYVPTTPNPTSGFYLIVAEAEVRESHMSVEEAFRTLLSLGIAQPSKTKARVAAPDPAQLAG